MILDGCKVTLNNEKATPLSLNKWLIANGGYTLNIFGSYDIEFGLLEAKLGFRDYGMIKSDMGIRQYFKKGAFILLHADKQAQQG